MASTSKRLSSIFRKKDSTPPADTTQYDHKLSSSMTNNTNANDSAYASSEHPSSMDGSNFTHMENHGQIRGVDSQRNLALNKNTGDVIDDDTGEVVSTVTTTTTTTTISRVGGKKTKVEVSTQPSEVQQQVKSRSPTPNIAEVHGDSVQPTQQHPTDTNHLSPSAAVEQPTIPNRSPHRKSREMFDYQPGPDLSFASSPPPPKSNFSYPSRANLRDPPSNTDMHNAPSHQSTFESLRAAATKGHEGTFDNLKNAAIGLHGVGETLRGTLNSEVDSRFPRHNVEKAAAANAKNQAVLDRGNNEIGRMSAHYPSQSQAPAARQHPAYRYDEPSGLGNGGGGGGYSGGGSGYSGGVGGSSAATAPAVSPIQPTATTAQKPWERPDNDMNYMPASFSPESANQAARAKEEKKGGFRKLLKKRMG